MLPNERPRLVGMMPGSLMYRAERSHGPARNELDVMRQVRCLASSASFSGVAEAELQVLLESIAQSIGRAEYHFQRFRVQRGALDELRAWAPGDVFFDDAVYVMHYELQALAGAARLLVDEVLFLIAKRHGTNHLDWKAAQVLRETIVPGSPADRADIHRLRIHRGWFDMLNSYRNAFFHSGWKHGSGHFERDGRQAGEQPGMNALLMPDRAALRRPPYEWTYNDRTSIDDVCGGIYKGLITMLGDLCTNEWGTPVPPPGTMTEEQRFNIIVALPSPIIVSTGDCLLAPIFSSRERAMEFTQFVPGLSTAVKTPALELLEVRSSPDVTPPLEMITVSFTRLTSDHGAKLLQVALDPLLNDGAWSHTAAASVPLEDLLNDKMRIVGIQVPEPMTAYLWRSPFLIQ